MQPRNIRYHDATAAECKCGCAFKDRSNLIPCLFDVTNDPSELNDLSAESPSLAAMRTAMWAQVRGFILESNIQCVTTQI